VIALLERVHGLTPTAIIVNHPAHRLNPLIYRTYIALFQQESTLYTGTVHFALGIIDPHVSEIKVKTVHRAGKSVGPRQTPFRRPGDGMRYQ
jgi:ABC-type multidrug transport system fused ATPase/permease subunit